MFFPYSIELFLPVLLIAFVLVFLMKQGHLKARNWDELDSLEKEYRPLVKTLEQNKMSTYLKQVEEIVDNLMIERDKVKKIKDAAQENDFTIAQAGALAKQAETSLRNIRKFIMSYEDHREEAISLFKNLRLTLLAPIENQAQVSVIMQKISNIKFIVEELDNNR